MDRQLKEKVQNYLDSYSFDDSPRKNLRQSVERRFSLMNVPDKELAEIFDVTPRTIARDQKQLRQDLADELEQDFSIAGELFSQYRAIITRMSTAIEEEDWPKTKALKRQWSIVKSFSDTALPIKVEKLTSLLERASSDGKFEVDLD